MKALDEYILMVLFVLLLKRVHCSVNYKKVIRKLKVFTHPEGAREQVDSYKQRARCMRRSWTRQSPHTPNTCRNNTEVTTFHRWEKQTQPPWVGWTRWSPARQHRHCCCLLCLLFVHLYLGVNGWQIVCCGTKTHVITSANFSILYYPQVLIPWKEKFAFDHWLFASIKYWSSNTWKSPSKLEIQPSFRTTKS